MSGLALIGTKVNSTAQPTILIKVRIPDHYVEVFVRNNLCHSVDLSAVVLVSQVQPIQLARCLHLNNLVQNALVGLIV